VGGHARRATAVGSRSRAADKAAYSNYPYALVAARDMTDIEGNVVRAMPKKQVQDFLRQHGLLR
jgi:hypothetical protein